MSIEIISVLVLFISFFSLLAYGVPVHTSIDRAAGHRWADFRFDHVKRVIGRGPSRGSVVTQWQVSCLHHRDPEDGPSTTCRKIKRLRKPGRVGEGVSPAPQMGT